MLSPKLSDFITARQITIDDEKTAIEIYKLIELITAAARIERTKLKSLYSRLDYLYHKNRKSRLFEYRAKKTEHGWKAIRIYVGPPASTVWPKVYNMELNSQNVLIKLTASLRRHPEWWAEPGS